jgi:hypothetical protein
VSGRQGSKERRQSLERKLLYEVLKGLRDALGEYDDCKSDEGRGRIDDNARANKAAERGSIGQLPGRQLFNSLESGVI